MSDENFLSRWSRRKVKARQGEPELPLPVDPPRAEGDGLPAATAKSEPPAPLPPVESLTPESDFAPFMRPDVDADTRRLAMKKLFEDPRFNVMDGLDVYIDDYSRPDPLPEGWLEKMNQVARLGIFKPAPEAPENEEGQAPEGADSALAQGSATAEIPSLTTPQVPSGEPLPSVTFSEEAHASPVPKSPSAKG